MKHRFAHPALIALAILTAVLTVSCANDNIQTVTLEGVVVSASQGQNGTFILAYAPDARGLLTFTAADGVYKTGDIVEADYNGMIMESYPGQIIATAVRLSEQQPPDSDWNPCAYNWVDAAETTRSMSGYTAALDMRANGMASVIDADDGAERYVPWVFGDGWLEIDGERSEARMFGWRGDTYLVAAGTLWRGETEKPEWDCAAGGHIYADGVCTVCGEAEAESARSGADSSLGTPAYAADPVTITDVEDWDVFGLDTPKENDYRYNAIKAFLERDTEKLEQWAGAADGAYDVYKSFVFGGYAVTLSKTHPVYPENESTAGFVLFDFTLTESDSDVLAPGVYRTVLDDGIVLNFIRLNEDGTRAVDVEFGEHGSAARYVYSTHAEDFDALTSGAHVDGDFIIMRLDALAGDFTYVSADEMKAYAAKYLGDDDYEIIESEVDKTDEGYCRIGRGSLVVASTLVSEEKDGDSAVVTVQFWADFSYTVKSKLVEFRLIYLDGEWKPLSSKTLEDTGIRTAKFAT